MALQWEGEVYPTAPAGFPPIAGFDVDDNGVDDFLDSLGNRVRTDEGLDPVNPEGGGGFGLPWDARAVWRCYRIAQSVIVGKNDRGSLSIYAGGKLRPCHLMIGENAGSDGEFAVSGFGSAFDNDWANIDAPDRYALELARPSAGPANWTWLYSNVAGYDKRASPPPPNNFNAWVGRLGVGRLLLTSGGYCRIRHRLFVGGYETIDDAETYTWPYTMAQASYLESVNKINSIGDLDTWEDGPGGAVYLGENAMIDVVGIAGGNEHEFEDDDDEPLFGESEATTALPNVFGHNSVMVMKGSTLRMGQGGELRGVVVVEPSEYPSRIISTAGSTDNSGVIVVRKGAKLALPGSVANSGHIFVEHGAALTSVGTISGQTPLPSKCNLTPLLLEAGVPSYVAEMVMEWSG